MIVDDILLVESRYHRTARILRMQRVRIRRCNFNRATGQLTSLSLPFAFRQSSHSQTRRERLPRDRPGSAATVAPIRRMVSAKKVCPQTITPPLDCPRTPVFSRKCGTQPTGGEGW
jgi:hypothetical protein